MALAEVAVGQPRGGCASLLDLKERRTRAARAGSGREVADLGGGLARTRRGTGISVCARSLPCELEREGAHVGTKSKKTTPRSGHQNGQKSSPGEGERGSLGAAPPRPARTPACAPFPPGPRGEGGSFVPGARVPSSPRPWAAPGVVSAAPGGGARGEGHRSLAAGDGAAGGGDRQGASRPLGLGAQFWCAFCFVLILSEVSWSAGGRARRARGTPSDPCEGAATACAAPAPGGAGRAQVQV